MSREENRLHSRGETGIMKKADHAPGTYLYYLVPTSHEMWAFIEGSTLYRMELIDSPLPLGLKSCRGFRLRGPPL